MNGQGFPDFVRSTSRSSSRTASLMNSAIDLYPCLPERITFSISSMSSSGSLTDLYLSCAIYETIPHRRKKNVVSVMTQEFIFTGGFAS